MLVLVYLVPGTTEQLRFHLLYTVVKPVPCHTIYHFLSAFNSSTAVSNQYGCPPPLPLSSLLASSAAWPSQLLSASSLCHLVMKHETFRRFDDSPIPLPTPLSRRGS